MTTVNPMNIISFQNQPKWDGGKLVIYSEFVKGTYKPSLATREITSDGDLLVVGTIEFSHEDREILKRDFY